MAGATNYQEEAELNATRGSDNVAWTPYVALFTTTPNDAGGGTEVSGGGYQRQAVSFSAPASASPGRKITNDADILFPEASINLGTVTHVGVFDAVSGGNLRFWGPLAVPVAYAGTIVRILAGQLEIRRD